MIHTPNDPLHLNQTALQDFQDCPRRFELRFLREAVWPAAQGTPLAKFEKLTEIGDRFHQLCQQFFIGIDEETLTSSISLPELQDLWGSFLPYGRSLLKYPYRVEQIIRIPFLDHYLVAKYDIVVALPDHSLVIIDWKTASKKPSRTALANRVQTFLYPFLLQQTARELFPSHPEYSSLAMQYYYPLSSEPEEHFPFSDQILLQAADKITSLIKQIEGLYAGPDHFPLTEDRQKCQFCLYRSYCERGFESNPLPLGLDLENEDLSNVHFDLDLIQEIEY